MRNAALAIETLRAAGIADPAIIKGIKNAKWPCRLEWVDGVLIDGAHNPDGASSLAAYIGDFFADKKITLITGMMKDKEIGKCAGIFSAFADEVMTVAADDQRAESPERLAEIYNGLGIHSIAIGDMGEALRTAREHGNTVIVAGSLYIAGEARRLLRGEECF